MPCTNYEHKYGKYLLTKLCEMSSLFLAWIKKLAASKFIYKRSNDSCPSACHRHPFLGSHAAVVNRARNPPRRYIYICVIFRSVERGDKAF